MVFGIIKECISEPKGINEHICANVEIGNLDRSDCIQALIDNSNFIPRNHSTQILLSWDQSRLCLEKRVREFPQKVSHLPDDVKDVFIILAFEDIVCCEDTIIKNIILR